MDAKEEGKEKIVVVNGNGKHSGHRKWDGIE